ncbi:MAG: very short patch repair endonuclease [Bacillota bacterium]
MADVLTKEQRRKNMQAIKAQSKLENKVSKELWKKGIRFRKNVKDLFGKPDIAIKKHKVVIFIDSCFWHCCDLHGNMPKTNSEFWREKLDKNKNRDQEVNRYYKNKGWYIKRIWEHEIKQDIDKVINEIINFIENAKNSN